MATASNVATSVDVLTAQERVQIVLALELRVAQLRRAINAEKDPDVKEIRRKHCAFVEDLIIKFR